MLKAKHIPTLRKILAEHLADAYVFGSYAKGNPSVYSDLDLYFEKNLSASEIGRLTEAFENSDLPFLVDIVEKQHCSESFSQLIANDLMPFEVFLSGYSTSKSP